MTVRQPENDIFVGLGERLKSERIRAVLTQADCGRLGGQSEQTQMRYETGKQTPKLDYLFRLSEHGFDVGYIVTGVRMDGSLDPTTRQIIELYQKLPVDVQATIFDLLSHLTGEYADLRSMVRADPATLHDRQSGYKPPPEDL